MGAIFIPHLKTHQKLACVLAASIFEVKFHLEVFPGIQRTPINPEVIAH